MAGQDRGATPGGAEPDSDAADRSTTWERLTTAVLVLGCAAVAAWAAVLGGASPVEASPGDALLVGLPVGCLTLLGAAVPRQRAAWLLLVAGGLSMSIVVAAVAAIAFVAARLVSVPRVVEPPARSATVGMSLVLCAYSQLGGPLGTSAIVGLSCGLVIVGLVLSEFGWRWRLAAIAGMAVVALPFAVSAVALIGSASATTSELRLNQRTAEDGLRRLADGDVSGGTVLLADAAEGFAAVEEDLRAPLHRPAALVPVVSQHRRLGIELTTTAGATIDRIVSELEGGNFDEFGVSDGAVDLDVVQDLAERLERIVGHVDLLYDEVTSSHSVWLLDRVTRQLEGFELNLAAERERAELAVDVLEAVPALLGADEPRRYFVAFTTQSEARGLSGLMGNWAEVTAADGRLSVTGFGRSDDLDDAAPPGERRLSEPAEWLARYGEFGFDSGPGGGVGTDPWKNITMSPQLTSTATVIRDLYPQSGGSEVDGVFFLDVDTLSILLRFTGSVRLDALDRDVGPQNVRQFLLKNQYDILDKTDRIDLLEDVSSQVVDVLLGGALPPPTELLAALGPQVEQRRLGGWAVRPDEQVLFDRIGLTTDLPEPTGRDSIAVSLNNLAGNKIDYYLRGSLDYDVQVSSDDGSANAAIRIELSNESPAVGEPQYVIGNLVDLPDGTNLTWLSVYSVLEPSVVRIDGVVVPARIEVEDDYVVTSVVVELAAGAVAQIEVDVAGVVPVVDDYELAVTLPPTVASFPLELSIGIDGTVESSEHEFSGSKIFSTPVPG